MKGTFDGRCLNAVSRVGAARARISEPAQRWSNALYRLLAVFQTGPTKVHTDVGVPVMVMHITPHYCRTVPGSL